MPIQDPFRANPAGYHASAVGSALNTLWLAGYEPKGDTPSVRLEKLEALAAANASVEGDVELLAELLSVHSVAATPL